MNFKRIFIAVPVPEDIRSRVQMLGTLIESAEGQIRWVGGKNLHLTLLFLGNIPVDIVEKVKTDLENIPQMDKFTFALESTGVFPNEKNPRVFWLGVGKGKDQLISLQSLVKTALVPYLQKEDDKPYTPHLTIGRVNKHVKLWKLNTELFLNAVYEPVNVTLDKFYLYQSELLPQGPRYTVLGEYPLN